MVMRGYQAKEVMELTGLTYRQIDHWVRSDIIKPRTVQKGNRTIRVFSFENLVVFRAAMKLLDFGLSFQVVKKAAAWLQEALEKRREGQFLFAIEGDNLRLLSEDPKEILEFVKGKCVVTLDIGQIINQLKKDIEALKSKECIKRSRISYAIPKIASA